MDTYISIDMMSCPRTLYS